MQTGVSTAAAAQAPPSPGSNRGAPFVAFLRKQPKSIADVFLPPRFRLQRFLAGRDRFVVGTDLLLNR